jgi:hypothetical protein
MTRDSLLRWTERALLAVGAGLGLWCAAILTEARFHQTAPIPQPPLVVTQSVLPGDAGDAKAAAVPAPAAGVMLGRLEAPSVNITVYQGDRRWHAEPRLGPYRGHAVSGHPATSASPDTATTFRASTHPSRRRARIQDRRPSVSISNRQDLIVGPDDVYVLDPRRSRR